MSALETVIAAIDAANAADPNREPDGRPAALLNGQRMSGGAVAAPSAECVGGSDVAARGEDAERWRCCAGPIRRAVLATWGLPAPTWAGADAARVGA